MKRLDEKIRTHNRHLEKMYATEGRLVGVNEWKHFPFYWIALFMSYYCTRRCSSCYSFNQSDGSVMEMTDSMFSRLLEWMVELYKANNVKINTCIFLGGEPTLRTDRVKKVMDYLFDHDAPMSGVVYTNGDIIDKIDWDDLQDITWFSINVTDVPLNEIERRMKVIYDRSNVINQTVVSVLDDFNLSRLKDIAIFGLENGYRLRLYRNIFQVIDPDYIKRLLAKWHELCDLLERYVVNGYDVHTTFLHDTLIPSWNLDSNPYHCGRRVVSVFPDGSVSPCIRNHTYKTGTILDSYNSSLSENDLFLMSIRRLDLPKECGVCSIQKVCQGGCPNDKLLHGKQINQKSLLCDVYKEIIPRLIVLDKLKTEQLNKEV